MSSNRVVRAVHLHPLCKFISLLFRPNYSRYVSGSPDVFPHCEKVKTSSPTAALCIISLHSGYAPAKLSQLSGDSVHRSRGRSMPDAIFEFGFRPRTRTTYAMCTCVSNLELSRNCKTRDDTVDVVPQVPLRSCTSTSYITRARIT